MYLSYDRHSWSRYFKCESISSSQSNLRFQSSCMINFGLIRQGETIPSGSKMEQSKLSNSRFVFKKVLSENFILSSSISTFHKIPKAWWVDSWSLCSAIGFFFSISVSGNWFRISWLFDKSFVNLNPDYLSTEITALIILVKCSSELPDFKKSFM